MEWVTEGAVIFLSHAFCHPLTTFGVLVIFFAYPGVWGFASSILSLATPSQAAASQLHPGLPAVALRAQ